MRSSSKRSFQRFGRPSLGRRVSCALLMVAIAATGGATARADKLRRAGKAIRNEDSEPQKARPRTSSASSATRPAPQPRPRGASGHVDEGPYAYDDTEHAAGDPEVAREVLRAIGFPWTLPYAFLEPHGAELTLYAPHPYADGGSGYLLGRRPPPAASAPSGPATGLVAGERPLNEVGRSFALQGSAETSYLWGELARFGAVLRLLTPVRLELDTSWSLTGERESSGNTLWVGWGTNHITWRFAQSEAIQFRTGIGTRHWIDTISHELGVDLFYGFEAMPERPLIFSCEAHLGSLGSAVVWQLRAGLGFMLDALELYVGYDHTQIADVQLGGPMLGLRVWL